MLFLVTWKMFDNTKLDCYRAFMGMTPKDDVADAGPNVTIVGRWHNVGSGSGVCIAETDDSAALTSWMVNWAGLCDIDLTPVTDDETTRAVLRSKLGKQVSEPAVVAETQTTTSTETKTTTETQTTTSTE